LAAFSSLPSGVLPFENMSRDPEQEYFVDGLVEDIITGLSRFKSLFVIARNSTFAYKGKSPDIRQVGRELGVRYVLEGSVRKVGAGDPAGQRGGRTAAAHRLCVDDVVMQGDDPMADSVGIAAYVEETRMRVASSL
jgi:hypothetical protein